MHNLLPQDYKRNMRAEYNTRWGVVFLVLFALTGVIAIVALSPSYFLSHIKYQTIQEQRQAVTSTLQVQNEKETVALLEAAKKKADTINSADKTSSLVSGLEAVLKHKKGDIHIREMRFGKVDEGWRGITLVGTADTRESLVAFSKSLQGDKTFKNVTLPVSNLAERANIGFTLHLSGNF